jgi:asparagine synthase (glutamine-hydrolysing)
LKCYIQWGQEFVSKINGMFAIVIYDKAEDILFITRDRVGIKPLYFNKNENSIAFSSEIKPLLSIRQANSINDNALWSYFNLRYVAGNETIFKNIMEFEPGHFMICKKNTIINYTTYWDLRKILPLERNPDPKELRNLLTQIISEHFCSDISISTLLSGGIDSAAITSYASLQIPNLTAYTFSTGLKNDELLDAQLIAEKLRINHKVIYMDKNIEQIYEKAIGALENPIGDSILLPTFLLMDKISKNHRVVLSGEGADEVFTSYIHHHFLSIEDSILKILPSTATNFLKKIIQLTPHQFADFIFPYPANLGKSGWNKVLDHLNNLDCNLERYLSLIELFPNDDDFLFQEILQKPKHLQDYWHSLGDMSFMEKIRRYDMYFWARNYTLHRLDRLSMNHSVEARVPFFDHRLIEYIFSISHELACSKKDPKSFMRRSLKNSSIPKKPLNRKKQAFYLPSEKVFSPSTLLKMKESILDGSERLGLYNKSQLEKTLKRDRIELLDSKKLLVLYNFELWSRIYLDKNWSFNFL